MTLSHDNQPSDHARNKARGLLSVVNEVRSAVTAGRPADAALGRLFKTNRKYGAGDRRFLADAVFSYFRWHGWLRMQDEDRDALACALSWWLDHDHLPPAIRWLATESGLNPDQLAPVDGLSLPEKSSHLGRMLGIAPPPPGRLIPDWVTNELFHSAEWIIPFIESIQRRPPTWLRVPHGRENEFIRAWSPIDPDARPHPTIPGAIQLSRPISRSHLFDKAAIPFEIQDLASQCVGLVCNPGPGQSWWDACSGAGGKALQLYECMQRTGRVRATDVRHRLLDELRRRTRRLGMRGIETLPLDAESQTPPDILFDGVLVDAPCSGMGTWSRNPDARWRCEASDIDVFSDRQYRLLGNAAGSVAPGGVLVYAVCTLTRKEGTGVVERFLQDHPSFTLDAYADPFTAQSVQGVLPIWPWQGPCDGMFMARMKRK